MTTTTQLVLRLLLADPTRERYGLEVGQETGLPSGTYHPILNRLEAVGWLESRWEEADPHQERRPRRRYYKLTRDGAVQARHALASASLSKRSSAVIQLPQLGLADGTR